jgi:hypothetical protein
VRPCLKKKKQEEKKKQPNELKLLVPTNSPLFVHLPPVVVRALCGLQPPVDWALGCSWPGRCLSGPCDFCCSHPPLAEPFTCSLQYFLLKDHTAGCMSVEVCLFFFFFLLDPMLLERHFFHRELWGWGARCEGWPFLPVSRAGGGQCDLPKLCLNGPMENSSVWFTADSVTGLQGLPAWASLLFTSKLQAC